MPGQNNENMTSNLTPEPGSSSSTALSPRLRQGCYLIRYTPLQVNNGIHHYDGTMRIEWESENMVASGDLYKHFILPESEGFFMDPSGCIEQNPIEYIPIFPLSLYHAYVVPKIQENSTLGNSISFILEFYHFNYQSKTFDNPQEFTAAMTYTVAPPEYPSSSDYLKGEVKNNNGEVVGNLIMGWISESFRRGTIEIDSVTQSEHPLNNGDGVNWENVFNSVGWKIEIIESQGDIQAPPRNNPNEEGFWNNGELHKRMLAYRDANDLENKWLYHLICVHRIYGTELGLMYDTGSTDSNNLPREGAAIASGWEIPTPVEQGAWWKTWDWGEVKGQPFGEATGPYFRTAVHEIGHAMSLEHNAGGNHFMAIEHDIIDNGAGTPAPYPDNIQWTFLPKDGERLRHFSDMLIRPGGIPFESIYYKNASSSFLDISDSQNGLSINVSPLSGQEVVPLGAPVRIIFKLKNNSNNPIQVPDSLSLKSGHVRGKVIDPAGEERTFRPIILDCGKYKVSRLPKNEHMTHAITLLRGAKGALFPFEGNYQIIVEVTWHTKSKRVGVYGDTVVEIKSPVDEGHKKAAKKIISEPDTLLTLVIGGDHLKEGIKAIKAGIDDKVLRPHYAIIEAKRIGNRFFNRPADFKKASEYIDEESVLTGPEINRVAEMVKLHDPEKKTENGKRLVEILQQKIKIASASEEIEEMVHAL